jgi:hypothetical protein
MSKLITSLLKIVKKTNSIKKDQIVKQEEIS